MVESDWFLEKCALTSVCLCSVSSERLQGLHRVSRGLKNWRSGRRLARISEVLQWQQLGSDELPRGSTPEPYLQQNYAGHGWQPVARVVWHASELTDWGVVLAERGLGQWNQLGRGRARHRGWWPVCYHESGKQHKVCLERRELLQESPSHLLQRPRHLVVGRSGRETGWETRTTLFKTRQANMKWCNVLKLIFCIY